MQLYTEDQISSKKTEILHKIEHGAIFVYPTDTVYGIGCNATDCGAVRKLRDIKETTKQLSVIVPSKEWVFENCHVSPKAKEWLDKLPGPYTLVLPLKNKNAICEEVTLNSGSIGVRMIDHHFQNFISEFGQPFVTTSANRTGKEIMTNLDRLDEKIKAKVDLVLYEGEKFGKSSQIIDLTDLTPKVLRD